VKSRERFTEQRNTILYPAPSPDVFETQREEVFSVIEDAERLVSGNPQEASRSPA